MTDENTIDFREHPFTCPYCGRGNDGAVAAGDGNDLDESRDLRTVRSRVSYRERRAEAVAAVEAASGKGVDLTAQ